MITKEVLDALSGELNRLYDIYQEAREKRSNLQNELLLVEQEVKSAEEYLKKAKESFRVFEDMFNAQNKNQAYSEGWLGKLQE